jgi:hypoxanthine-DNA glycosylase
VYRRDAKLLVLGSLPGEQSLVRQQYYAHPQNQFWKLIGDAIETDFVEMPYAARLATLVHRRIALWDVVAVARRAGSLDSNLRDVSSNDLDALVQELPDLRAIAFNGGMASKAGRRILVDSAEIELVTLPSSSPAYTLALAEKQREWKRLRCYLGDLEP